MVLYPRHCTTGNGKEEAATLRVAALGVLERVSASRAWTRTGVAKMVDGVMHTPTVPPVGAGLEGATAAGIVTDDHIAAVADLRSIINHVRNDEVRVGVTSSVHSSATTGGSHSVTLGTTVPHGDTSSSTDVTGTTSSSTGYSSTSTSSGGQSTLQQTGRVVGGEVGDHGQMRALLGGSHAGAAVPSSAPMPATTIHSSVGPHAGSQVEPSNLSQFEGSAVQRSMSPSIGPRSGSQVAGSGVRFSAHIKTTLDEGGAPGVARSGRASIGYDTQAEVDHAISSTSRVKEAAWKAARDDVVGSEIMHMARMDDIAQDAQRVKAKLSRMGSIRDDVEAERLALHAEIQALQRDLRMEKDMRNRLQDHLEEERKTWMESGQEMQAKVATLEEEVTAQHTARRRIEAERVRARHEVDNAVDELQAARGEREAAQERLRGELELTVGQLNARIAEVQELTIQGREKDKQLFQVQEELKAFSAEAQDVKCNSEVQRKCKEAEIVQLTTVQESLEGQLAQATKRADQLALERDVAVKDVVQMKEVLDHMQEQLETKQVAPMMSILSGGPTVNFAPTTSSGDVEATYGEQDGPPRMMTDEQIKATHEQKNKVATADARETALMDMYTRDITALRDSHAELKEKLDQSLKAEASAHEHVAAITNEMHGLRAEVRALQAGEVRGLQWKHGRSGPRRLPSWSQSRGRWQRRKSKRSRRARVVKSMLNLRMLASVMRHLLWDRTISPIICRFHLPLLVCPMGRILMLCYEVCTCQGEAPMVAVVVVAKVVGQTHLRRRCTTACAWKPYRGVSRVKRPSLLRIADWRYPRRLQHPIITRTSLAL